MPTQRRLRLKFLAAAMMVPGLLLAETNNGWRGPENTGVFPAKDIVTSADEASGKNIVWKTPLPFFGNNSPVYAAGRVFVLTDAGWKTDAPTLHCLDVNTGKVLWERPVDNLDARPPEEAAWARKERAKEYAMARRARELIRDYDSADSDEKKQQILSQAKAEGFHARLKGRKLDISLTSRKMVFTQGHAKGQDYKRLSGEGLFFWEGWYYTGLAIYLDNAVAVTGDIRPDTGDALALNGDRSAVQVHVAVVVQLEVAIDGDSPA